MHNDEPALVDLLARQPLVREVGDAIANCKPPQVFGIHGDWGLGKTSFLQQVHSYLTNERQHHSVADLRAAKSAATTLGIVYGQHAARVHPIWFDAWRYQHEDAPVVALLHEIRAQLTLPRKAIRTASRYATATVQSALFSIENLTKHIGIHYSRFREASREWQASRFDTPLPSNTIRQCLHDAIAQLLQATGSTSPTARLVVFIDDVDRCEPQSAYRLLEGLKIYLRLPNCVFVLGMNQKAVETAIGASLPGRSADSAAEYLEKLCQNVWRLPAVRSPGKVLGRFLDNNHMNWRVRKWIAGAAAQQHCFPPNPRRLKGLANLIARMSSRFPDPGSANREEVATRAAKLLLIAAYIYQFHPDIYVRWETNLALYTEIYGRCQGAIARSTYLPFLEKLVMPDRVLDTDPTRPTPREDRVAAYADPADPNVFWIQPLVLELGDEVQPDEFAPFLHGDPS